MKAALNGIKVLEFSVAMAGPFCGMLLADFGAEVIKVERPGFGDESRAWPPFFDGKLSHYFAAANRNKKSVCIDLKSEAGIVILRRMAQQADVIIDNFRLGALERIGLDYEALRKDNPRLIYCRITGYGASGPLAGERANDLAIQAYSGGMSLTGEADRGPVRMGISVADIGAGMFATIGILTALVARSETGTGQLVDASLLEGQVAMLANHFTSFFSTGAAPVRRGSSGPGMVPYQAFKASDDWMVVASFTERMWRGVARAVGKPEWGDDPRYADAKVRLANRDELVARLAEIFRTRPVAVWEARLKAEGVPVTRVNSVDRVACDPQVLARDLIATLRHPAYGEVRMPGPAVKLSHTPAAIRMPPPMLGEHTHEVLSGLGIEEATMNELEQDGIIAMYSAMARA
ncbi:CaiB/BaiF CoA transferase family protein [Aquamicrobium terrae]|uniref:Crotonobetainyl-CoA:carnitine CoA-transferase CaiB-like acyl-CoA transferase n=1 Tax=Aquamicrobium terrae TaxID=1324945 RepID=A0ABV2N7C5_9HYPH